jgi:hypothetical protein
VIESQVRRATVLVNWKEGSSDQSFDLVQFLVNEAAYVPIMNEEEDPNLPGGGGVGGGAGPGGGAAPGSSTGGASPGEGAGGGK